MFFKRLQNVLATPLLVLGAVSLVGTAVRAEPNFSKVQPPPSSPRTTQFDCVNLGGGDWGTYARQGSNQAMLVRWTPAGSHYFGGNYTPQRRCEIVTGKLNNAVQANGGRLSNLLLTNGYVNGETVICALGPLQTQCTDGNMLFTLKPENAHRAGEILGQLLQISRYGSSAGYITETSGQVYVDLGDWAEGAFGETTDAPMSESEAGSIESAPDLSQPDVPESPEQVPEPIF